jgi:hypothetical protein
MTRLRSAALAAVKIGFDYANLNFGIHNLKQFYFCRRSPAGARY